MVDEYAYDEPIGMNEVRKVLGGRRLDIQGMFRFAKEQGVKVSDLSVEEKKMFLK